MKISEIEGVVGPTPPAGVLASYTDRDGYTISIVGIPDDPMGYGRCGGMYISDGKTSVKAGYWMNRPERAWNIPETQWERMPWAQRAALEAKQQATAYAPLKSQFAYHATRHQGEGAHQLVARKWDTGQNLSPAEAKLFKKMMRSEFHQQIDQRTSGPANDTGPPALTHP